MLQALASVVVATLALSTGVSLGAKFPHATTTALTWERSAVEEAKETKEVVHVENSVSSYLLAQAVKDANHNFLRLRARNAAR